MEETSAKKILEPIRTLHLYVTPSLSVCTPIARLYKKICKTILKKIESWMLNLSAYYHPGATKLCKVSVNGTTSVNGKIYRQPFAQKTYLEGAHRKKNEWDVFIILAFK